MPHCRVQVLRRPEHRGNGRGAGDLDCHGRTRVAGSQGMALSVDHEGTPVNAERWRQVDTILKEALERKPCDRATFLDSACANNSSLRGEVEALIRAYEQADSFLEAPIRGSEANQTTTSVSVSMAGQTLGHYKVER